MSLTPYNDAFEEELDLRKFNFTLHRTAGMSFTPQDTRLILVSMVPSTPGARIPRWRTRLRGAWLLSVDGTLVDSIASVQQAFNCLSLSCASSCILLFVHPEISHRISNRGLPLLHCDQFTQQSINQLSDRWTPKPTIPPDLPKTPNWDIVVDTMINEADHFTKLLSRVLFHRHIDYLMGHVPPDYSPAHERSIGQFDNPAVKVIPDSYTTNETMKIAIPEDASFLPAAARAAHIYSPDYSTHVNNFWSKIVANASCLPYNPILCSATLNCGWVLAYIDITT